MWGGFFSSFDGDSVEIRFLKEFYIQTFLSILALIVAIGAVFIAILIIKRRQKRFERLKNLQLVEEYFQNISKRILEAEEKLPYLKLTMSYKDVEERFNNVTLNFTYLKEYYDGIKKSYSESELKTFLNIYRIIKNDLDFIEEVLKNSETILKKEIERKEKIDRELEAVKNKQDLKSRINEIYEIVYSEDVLKEKIEGIKRLDEKIEYYKNLPENKKEEYLTNLISFVTKEFEEKYPLILAKLPRLAENIKKEYDELLARLKVSEDVGKLILIEEFLDRFSKLDSDLFKEKTYEKTYNKAIVDKFAELRTEYDNVGMKFYKIDLKIDQVERLIQSGARQDVVEKELEILSMLISNFKKDASECKRLLESFSSFLQKARSRISNRYDFDMLESYKESLKDLYYECNFDEFKKRYIEAENLARNIVLKSFPYRKEDFLKRSFKDFFDDFFDRC
ncbi:hypothetical protein Csac_0115 [Caldicellulosiruptor saccharolyticus DSM 8903]|uniref:Uncharacterized protein n=1 Tax=Caldicellulosiruptor saccharolyticus (strain ATCC 43494 / DSM 8903 / Tp8T 6331) TaxID=351627 RepID=A4XFT3_CALS8|nr:hypothetical protein [Caldicellulosiruptor saccharolyticus]ABP65768.1 hypothetical protein Csac_0115 [Caldicellulosiruptor saccharolyticus DSM 8903]